MNHTDTKQIESVRSAFELQKNHRWVLKMSSAEERVARLKSFKLAIQKYEKQAVDALYQDLRKPRVLAESDIAICYAEIDDAVENLARWMAPRQVSVSQQFTGGKAEIRRESLGIVLLFGPWNYPLHLVLQPLVSIVAAGNCALVKPNEMAPATSRVLAKIISESFTEKEVALFEGGVDLANDLLELPVNHIFFTGSPAVGKIVMRAAAEHLASVTLELGGKNPVIIDSSADISDAAEKIALYRGMNSGQICLCPENVWVKEEYFDTFINEVKENFTKIYFKDGKLEPDATGRIIDVRNFERVTGYITDALERGAKLICGGGSDPETLTIEPTILVDVPKEALILSEEVFGPILCVSPYSELECVINEIQSQPKPLALYPFTRNKETLERILEATSSGGVTVNNCMMHCVEHNLPFGGVNNSGIGAYHGEHGFNELTHGRAILHL